MMPGFALGFVIEARVFSTVTAVTVSICLLSLTGN